MWARYILQLAIANSLFLLTIPLSASEKINQAWLYSTGLCKGKETILFLNYYASIIFITILSVDRYFSVCKGFKNVTKRRYWIPTYVITIITWICSIIICIPIMLYSGKFKSGSYGSCVCAYDFPDPNKLTGEDFCLANNFTTAEKLEDCLRWAPKVGQSDNKCPEKWGIKEDNITEYGDYNMEYDYSGHEQILLGNESSFDELTYNDEATDLSDVLTIGCHYHTHGEPLNIFLYVNFFVMFLLPFMVICAVYVTIIRRVRNVDTNLQPSREFAIASVSFPDDAMGQEKQEVQKRTNRQRRVTVMCGLILITFVICWLPFHATHLAKIVGIHADSKSNICQNLGIMTSLFAYMHAAINPYLYIFARGTKKLIRTFVRGKREMIKATTAITKTIATHSSSATFTDTKNPKETEMIGKDGAASQGENKPLPQISEVTVL
uniref:uncharacterized protein LOC120329865 n=1 Tax=Styela clava TaxID=7725 RepID=UPI00193A5477|nr:uncharacterized protein LOC120329865 [Styela clava]